MKYNYSLKGTLAFAVFMLIALCQSNVFSQLTLTATGGVPAGSYASINDAFTSINAGTHTGSIVISVNGNTTEPAVPVNLAASGQGAASYTAILIKPTVTATIAGATSPGSAVINLDGADNVTIDGSIAVGGTTRDLTIQNTALNSVGNVACIRLIGRTTLGLGATNNTIKNCIITGNTPGNNGLSGSTVTTTYGIYAGSAVAATMAATTGGADYDNLTIQNNLVTNAYFGVNIIGLVAPNQADNLQILDNTVGSVSARIGFKGIVGQHVVGGSATNNTVTAIEATSSISVAGIDFAGSASNGFAIRRNTISDIHSYSAGGWGAYGINITSGINYSISNNVIHGVQSVNYTTSTTFNAYGIRLAGGTGHQVYYNSVNMYGAYTTGSATNALASALVVTSTAVTGLDVRNNVFANKMTSNAATPEFFAVLFPTGYNFLNANLERNAYFVTADAVHFVGKIGLTVGVGNYSTLVDWRAISQINNASNDINSHPGTGNSNAPFTSDANLTIPAATITVMESTGLPVASLGLPNVDRNNINRPAGSGTNPDLGAYEFEGTIPGDLVSPIVSGVSVAPGSSCTNVAHVVTATASDNIGVTSVTIAYAYNGVPQTPITMTLTAGTALSGTYSGTIPAAVGANVTVTYSVSALDAALNTSNVVAGASYADSYLVVTASADQTINTGVPTNISATTNDLSFARLLISEVIQFKTGTGDGTYPGYIPAVDNDFVEISNIGDVATDAGGYTLSIYGGTTGTYTIPANTIIPAGGTLVLAFSGTTSDPANLYFGMNLTTTSSGVACGYVLKNPQGQVRDAVATNSYVFPGASGVTGLDWSGNIPSSAGLAGVRRTVATDNNLATDWTLSASVTNLTTIGVYNPQITIIPIPQTIVWTNNFGPATSTLNPLPVAAFGTPGVYTYYATFNDGTCSATDSVVITVQAPVAPVANFSATPLFGTAPLSVAFTDLSTNIPTSWLWTISPMAGVTYTSGTSASQNPVVSFANAGLYTITLQASNIAGSDDSTKVNYIVVDFCNSSALNTGDTDIGNVTFGALNNGTATPVFSNPAANALYTNNMMLPVQNYIVGQSYPISVSQITSGATFYNAFVNVFIDYNNDGGFDALSERVFSGATSSIGPIATVTGSVTIPLTATVGNVRMRVILDENGDINSPGCGTYAYGETEDYIVNIQCASAVPLAGGDTICSGQTGTLTASGTAVQWYADAVTPVVLATGSTYITPALTSTTSYFASSTDLGCGESSRSEFIVTVNQPTSATQTITACASYTWPINSTTYTTTGMYTAVIPNFVGCDSTITLDLTILNPATSTDVQSACNSYSWIDGNTYTASNNSATFTITGGAANGCDSTITLDLTINNSTTGTDVQTACGSYTWIDGNTYTASNNTATFTLTNAVGCDSVITLNLTINTVDVGVTNTSPTLTSNATGAVYQWLDCNNSFAAIPSETNQAFTAAVNGDYAVLVTQNGCTDTSACQIVNNVGIAENSFGNGLLLYPNPTAGDVNIDLGTTNNNVAVIIRNTLGQVVLQKPYVDASILQLNIPGESGVYFIEVTSGDKKAIWKVIKE
jgi:PKD repeat protein